MALFHLHLPLDTHLFLCHTGFKNDRKEVQDERNRRNPRKVTISGDASEYFCVPHWSRPRVVRQERFAEPGVWRFHLAGGSIARKCYSRDQQVAGGKVTKQ